MDWEQTGLLTMVDDRDLMIRALNIARHLIIINDLENMNVVNMIFPIIYRIYNNKRLEYSDAELENNVQEYFEYLNSEELRIMVDDLLSHAYTTVDVEAEVVQIVSEYFNWNEDE